MTKADGIFAMFQPSGGGSFLGMEWDGPPQADKLDSNERRALMHDYRIAYLTEAGSRDTEALRLHRIAAAAERGEVLPEGTIYISIYTRWGIVEGCKFYFGHSCLTNNDIWQEEAASPAEAEATLSTLLRQYADYYQADADFPRYPGQPYADQ